MCLRGVAPGWGSGGCENVVAAVVVGVTAMGASCCLAGKVKVSFLRGECRDGCRAPVLGALQNGGSSGRVPV